MIPLIGLIIWAYGMARIVEVVFREGDRKPHAGAGTFMIIMAVVMCFSCCGLMLSGKGVTP